MQRLRIGIDARPLAYPRTGIGQYTKNIIDRLRQYVHLDLFLYTTHPIEYATQLNEVVRTADSKIPGALTSQFIYPRWARRDRLHVFWSPRHHLPLAITCACVVTIHDMVWLKHPDTMARAGAFIERLLMPFAIRKATSIICVSQATKTDLVGYAPGTESKVAVIYEASSRASKPDGHEAPPAKPYFLFVGTKEPRKNLANCLQAWKSSKVANEGFRLVLAGGQGWKFTTKTHIENLELEESVDDIEPNEEELNALYQHCHAVVLPSLYEGFGLPLVEGMSFGKPLIASNNSSMPEVAADAAIYADSDDPDQLAAAFRRMTTDPNLHNKLARKSAERARLFSWDAAADQTLLVLEEAAY